MIRAMTFAEQFVTDVEAFLTRSGMSATNFGREVVNDPNFMTDLRNGRDPKIGMVDRVYEFIRAKTQALENP